MDEAMIVQNSFLRLRKESTIDACCEVPLLGRFIDLAYIKNNILTAIEFKLHDWKRAVRQSYDHRLGADFAYICMPERRVSEKMEEEIKAAGVGLIFYCEEGEWPFREIIKAPKSAEVWSGARHRLKEYIKENQGITFESSTSSH